MPVARVLADMTKTEFIGKLEKEVWKFAGKCREKVERLRFDKNTDRIRVVIQTKTEWHRIFIGKNCIKIYMGPSRFFADRRFVYYRWRKSDDHGDVIMRFVDLLTQYVRVLTSNGKAGGTYGFFHALQNYQTKRYMDGVLSKLCDASEDT